MKVENIIFDLDGTLADTLPGIEAAAAAAVAAVLPQAQVPDFHAMIGPPVRTIFRQALGNLEPRVLDALEEEFRLRYDDTGWRESSAYAGVIETLSSLAGSGVGNYLATNKPIVPTKKIMDHLDLTPYFVDIVSMTSRRPPFGSKLEVASHIIAEHGLDRRETVLVGDSEDDARAALGLGIDFVAAAYGYGGVQARDDLPRRTVLTAFPDLLDIV